MATQLMPAASPEQPIVTGAMKFVPVTFAVKVAEPPGGTFADVGVEVTLKVPTAAVNVSW